MEQFVSLFALTCRSQTWNAASEGCSLWIVAQLIVFIWANPPPPSYSCVCTLSVFLFYPSPFHLRITSTNWWKVTAIHGSCAPTSTRICWWQGRKYVCFCLSVTYGSTSDTIFISTKYVILHGNREGHFVNGKWQDDCKHLIHPHDENYGGNSSCTVGYMSYLTLHDFCIIWIGLLDDF